MTQLYSPSLVPPPNKAPTEDKLESTVDLAQELYELPTVTGARFVPQTRSNKGTSLLQLTTSTKSLSALTKRSATQTLVLSVPDSSVLATTPLVSTAEEVKHTALSPDGSRQAVFRVIPAKNGKEQKRVVEVVDPIRGVKQNEVDVSSSHGDFYFDSTFGAPAWHPTEPLLVYTAEAPPPKPDPQATRPSQSKFHYEPDFGETFTAKREPTLFFLVLPSSPLSKLVSADENKEEASVHRLTFPDTVPSTFFGQAVFAPSSGDEKDQLVLAATGYSSLGDGRKLGIVYCTNRPARVYALSLKVSEETADDQGEEEQPKKTLRVVDAVPVSPADRSSRSPRFLPTSTDSLQLCYLSNPQGGPHGSCAQLHVATLSPSSASVQLSEDKVLVPVVDVPDSKNPGAGTASDPFPGLYVDQLPLEPFLHSGAGTSLVLSSIWRSRSVPLVVDLASGKVTSLAPWPERRDEEDAALPYLYLSKQGKGDGEDPLASLTVLGTDGESRVVALRSSPVSLPEVVVGKFGGGETSWTVVRKAGLPEKLSTALSKLSYTVLPLPKFSPTELILISPSSIDPTAPSRPNLPPLITQPHGGPHSTVVTSWNTNVAAMLLAGYQFVHVNYPGSLGFGQAAVEVLPPQLGTLEVEATLAAPHYLNQLSLASRTPGKRLLMGGSHGGWTACHLTARWPEEFDAVVMRNPVTDLVGNANLTDIPDWCYAEGDLAYPFSSPPSHLTPETYAAMHRLSPIRFAHQVKTPTLLLIGADDRRVPPDQGRAWFHALKNPGKTGEREKVEVEMLKFPGNGHPIAESVEAEWVAWEAGLRWLARFTDFA
ncbi:hypothetical protein JCM8097_000474 [Rhodosporidiobolus ruineniae]